jgi:integrase
MPKDTTRIFQREVLPYWGSWTVKEVRKRDVITLLDRLRERGAPIMANRVLAAVRTFFNWCIGRGIFEVSPCSGIAAPARAQARHRILSDEELAAVLAAAREIGFPFGSLVEALALTGQRRDEVGRMTWGAFALAAAHLAYPRRACQEWQAAPRASEHADALTPAGNTPDRRRGVFRRR